MVAWASIAPCSVRSLPQPPPLSLCQRKPSVCLHKTPAASHASPLVSHSVLMHIAPSVYKFLLFLGWGCITCQIYQTVDRGFSRWFHKLCAVIAGLLTRVSCVLINVNLYIDMLTKIISEEHAQLIVVNLQQWVCDYWWQFLSKWPSRLTCCY